MKFGVREICDVVLKAKSDIVIGNQSFKKDEPVMYFDTAKTSTVEGAATTVYATGGKGNARLIAWEGERTVTFTMEDALMSPLGFAILSGAGIIDAGEESLINIHMVERVTGTASGGNVTLDLNTLLDLEAKGMAVNDDEGAFVMALDGNGNIIARMPAKQSISEGSITLSSVDSHGMPRDGAIMFLVDFYCQAQGGVQQIEITPDKFAGSYYLEADTLFRRQEDGVDMPAQFIIPNVKIQSNFNFAMASSGDPSTFTFTMDAFPDYTKFDKTKKVLFALQIVDEKAMATAGAPEVASVMSRKNRKPAMEVK